jgi:hypothetical protein
MSTIDCLNCYGLTQLGTMNISLSERASLNIDKFSTKAPNTSNINSNKSNESKLRESKLRYSIQKP